MSRLTDTNAEGVALHGYDPVSYFERPAPLLGKPALTAEFAGAIYRFATPRNRTRFLANPDVYVPQYGGFCAIAVSEGHRYPVDPLSYLIAAGKLYLFYRGELAGSGSDRKQRWQADPEGRRARADAFWAREVAARAAKRDVVGSQRT